MTDDTPRTPEIQAPALPAPPRHGQHPASHYHRDSFSGSAAVAGLGPQRGAGHRHPVRTWLRLGRIAHGPLFRRIAAGGKEAGPDRLTDRHVARLVKRTALAAGVRGDLKEEGSAGYRRSRPPVFINEIVNL